MSHENTISGVIRRNEDSAIIRHELDLSCPFIFGKHIRLPEEFINDRYLYNIFDYEDSLSVTRIAIRSKSKLVRGVFHISRNTLWVIYNTWNQVENYDNEILQSVDNNNVLEFQGKCVGYEKTQLVSINIPAEPAKLYEHNRFLFIKGRPIKLPNSIGNLAEVDETFTYSELVRARADAIFKEEGGNKLWVYSTGLGFRQL